MRNNNSTIVKKILFLIFLILLCIPFLQQRLLVINIKPLGGFYTIQEDSHFSIKGWLDGSYQEQEEKYLNDNFGFRNCCVRLDNQIAFSVFNYAKANNVIIGKDNFLYEENYINSYLGKNFIGINKIISQVQKLKKIQDILKTKNIELIVVIAPGKGAYYPEYIPDVYNGVQKNITNYAYYLKEMKRKKINYLDFNGWFLQMKDTSPYPLYPKTGIHWSKYGEIIAADSIIKYIELLHNVNMPHLKIGNLQLSDTIIDTDDDIERGMNLIFDIPDLKMAYPSLKIINDSNTSETKVLTIADSFFWGMYNWGISKKVFNNGQFWYYNKQIYPDSYTKPIKVEEIDIIKEVEKNNVVVLMSTDANLFSFPWGFIDQLYAAYFGKEKNYKNVLKKRIEYYVRLIKKSPKWMIAIEKKAKKKNLSIEQTIINEAKFMVRTEN